MGTDTSSALDQPRVTAANTKPPRDKVMRIATMTKQLLDEVRTHPLDSASLNRLRTIDTQIVGELLTDLSPDLRHELQRLAEPLTRQTELSDAELRLAHAQLVGWLQGLLQAADTALSDPRAVEANDSITVETVEGTSTSSAIPTRRTCTTTSGSLPRRQAAIAWRQTNRTNPRPSRWNRIPIVCGVASG